MTNIGSCYNTTLLVPVKNKSILNFRNTWSSFIDDMIFLKGSSMSWASSSKTSHRSQNRSPKRQKNNPFQESLFRPKIFTLLNLHLLVVIDFFLLKRCKQVNF